MRPVLSKLDFTRRYAAGEFGNASPTWHSLPELVREASQRCSYHLRNRIVGGPTHYNLSLSTTVDLWNGKPEPDQWYASEMAPTERTVLQGEVMLTETGLYLYFSRVTKPMRDALREQADSVCCLSALLLLRRCLCWNSYSWLMQLLENYPDHVVEFSTYEIPWGTLYPLYNTVFWEVRKY